MKKAMVFEGILAIALVLLCFMVYIMVTSGDRVAGQWNSTGMGQAYFMAPNGDSLYAFDDNTVKCLDTEGNLKWSYTDPDHRPIISIVCTWLYMGAGSHGYPYGYYNGLYPIFDVDNGTMYLYTMDVGRNQSLMDRIARRPCDWAGTGQAGTDVSKRITAISDGKALWSYTINEPIVNYDPDAVLVHDGRIFFHHNYNETVLDENGMVLFNITGTSDPVTVDDEGNIYAVKVQPADYVFTTINRSGNASSGTGKLPSGIVQSFYPNGTLRWEKDVGEDACRQFIYAGTSSRFDTLPIYYHGSVYVPTASGVIALDTNGNEKWGRALDDGYYSFLELMPFDDDGNIYLQRLNERQSMPYTIDANPEKNLVNVSIYLNTTHSGVNESYIIKISPDGNVSPKRQFDKDWEMFTGMDGVLYIGMHVDAQDGGMMTEEVTAMDLSDGKVLWKYRVPTGDAISSTLAATSTGISVPSRDTLPHHITFDPPLNTTNGTVPAGYVGDWLGTGANLCAGDGVIYVYFDSFRIEWPPRYSANYSYVKGVYGVNYTYVRGVYALDTRGHLLWQKPEDSPVTSMVVNNSTVFYGIKDGKISSTSIELAAGLTLAALSYIFVRFFLLGAVSRARDRLGINQNRNSVLEYVRAHPASTLGDISNGLGMNIGTVRYHILILGINHRVVSMRADDRFVRYFTNSGSYSKEQQLVLSLLKREGARKVLNKLLERPGISNAELSKCLNVSEVAVSKSIRVLLEKGIVVKEPVDGKTNAYFIDKKYTEPIASAMERTGSQQ